MTTTATDEAKELGLETDQLIGILGKGREVTNGKSISKFHKREHKRVIHKIGLQSLMPRFNKTPKFWKILSFEMVHWDFIQGDFDMPPYILHEMKRLFSYYYNYVPTVMVNGIGYTPYEIDKLTFSFINAVEGSFSEESKVYKTCKPFNDHIGSEEVFHLYLENMRKVIWVITRNFSSLHSWSYVADFQNPRRSKIGELECRYTITINRKKSEIYSQQGEYPRNYYKFETTSEYLFEFIPVRATLDGKNYPVYIQRHALERVHERVGLELKYVTTLLLTQVSYRDVRTYKGKLLIPLYSNNSLKYKLGYLLGSIKEERFLIDTFLFISQDGTPEGDKLNELMAINKVEKRFLELDRVEHFVKSNLKDDEELYPIFETCNLSHLFKLYYEKGNTKTFTKNAEFIKDMLQLDNSTLADNFTSAEDLQKEFMAS